MARALFVAAAVITAACCAWGAFAIWGVFHPGGSGEWIVLAVFSVYVTCIPGGALVAAMAFLLRDRRLKRIAFAMAALTLSMALLVNLAMWKHGADRRRELERQLQQLQTRPR